MKRSIVLWVMAAIFTVALCGTAVAEIPISKTPVWESEDDSFTTGIGFADFNSDGWNDLIITNGLDGSSQPDRLYLNNAGVISTTPAWVSDVRPSSNIFIGDLNNDGATDLVIANLGVQTTLYPHYIHYNDGGLSSTADWFSRPSKGFSCTGGDPDGDGDIDIVFAQGNAGTAQRLPCVMYENVGGVFDTIPSWESDSLYYGVDAEFVDIDNDGDHDLILSGKYMGVAVFYNHGGVLETTASWRSMEIIGARQMAIGDVDGDGDQDMVAAGIGSLPGYNGGYFLFRNLGDSLETQPSWYCTTYPEPSCVALADADGDGDLDLACGGWFGPFGVFENEGGSFGDDLAWYYSGGGRGQQVAWGDFDEDGIVDTVEEYTGDGSHKVYHVSRSPVHEITSIEVDGTPLGLSDYCYDRMKGWISLAEAPVGGATLSIAYQFSTDNDLGITGLEQAIVFENLGTEYEPHPSDVDVLVMMDHNYGANTNMGDGTRGILEHLEDFGWNVTLTALFPTVNPCSYAYSVGCRAVDTDVLIPDVTDISQYDVLVMATNNSNSYLLASPEAMALINSARDAGLVIASVCRSTRLLSSAGVIEGREVVGHSDYDDEYEAAGGIYIGHQVPPHIDRNIVSGARGKYYRSQICEAIANALQPPSVSDVVQVPLDPSLIEPILVTARSWDNTHIAAVELYVDTGNGFFVVPMYDDGMHDDGVSGDSTYGGTIPALLKTADVSYYLRTTDDVGATAFDPPNAPLEFHTFSASGCCGVYTGGFAGNCNCDADGKRNLADITKLIDRVYITKAALCCEANGNVNGDIDGKINLADVSRLIDHAYLTKAETAECP